LDLLQFIWQFIVREYKPKRKVKPRFYIFLLLLIISICILVHFYNPTVKIFFSELVPDRFCTSGVYFDGCI
jgi:hypothetical protein